MRFKIIDFGHANVRAFRRYAPKSWPYEVSLL